MLGLAAVALGIFFAARLWRLRREPNRPAAFAPPIGFALFIALVLAAMIGGNVIGSLIQLEGSEGMDRTFENGVLVQACSYGMQSVVAIVFLILVVGAARQQPDTRSKLWAAALLGVVALLLTWPVARVVALGVSYIETTLTEEPVETLAHDTLRAMIERPADSWFIAQAVLVIVFAPILEEILYRGVFQETLRRLDLGPWPAILGTSVFFAIMHWSVVELHALVSLLVLSIGFGWIYERTGRLTAPIVMHALFNAGNLGIALLARDATAAASLLP